MDGGVAEPAVQRPPAQRPHDAAGGFARDGCGSGGGDGYGSPLVPQESPSPPLSPPPPPPPVAPDPTGVLFQLSDARSKRRMHGGADAPLPLMQIARARRERRRFLPPVQQGPGCCARTQKMAALEGGRTPALVRGMVVHRLAARHRIERQIEAETAAMHAHASRAHNLSHGVYEMPTPEPRPRVEDCILRPRLAEDPSGKVFPQLRTLLASCKERVFGGGTTTGALRIEQAANAEGGGGSDPPVAQSVVELLETAKEMDSRLVRRAGGSAKKAGGGGGGGGAPGFRGGPGEVLTIGGGMVPSQVSKPSNSKQLRSLPQVRNLPPPPVFALPESAYASSVCTDL